MMILGVALFMGKAETSTAIASIAMSLGAVNAYEKKGSNKGHGPINKRRGKQ